MQPDMESDDRYEDLSRNSPVGILLENGSRRIVDVNEEFRRMLGISGPSEALIGADCLAAADACKHLFIEPEDFVNRIEEILRNKRAVVGEKLWLSDGQVFERDYTPVYVEEESRVHLWHYRDVTEREQKEEALRETEKRLQAVTSGAPVILFTLDKEGRVTLAQGKGLGLLGLTSEQAIGQPLLQPNERAPALADDVRRALSGEEVSASVEYDGGALEVSYSPLWGEDGEVEDIIGVATDVTDRRSLEKELEYRSYYDSLTGLANQTLFANRLEHALERGVRRTENISILLLDLDNFKSVNETWGQTVGDELLVEATKRLRSFARPGDTVARLGGDEFAMLLEDTDREHAIWLAEQAEKRLREPFLLGDREVLTSVSIGLSSGSSSGGGAAELLREAESAMYRVKQEGKAGYGTFDPNDYARFMVHPGPLNELRRAIEDDELEVFYQPIMSLKSGRLACAEALVRWNHPEKSILAAGKFVPLAEESGLIIPLGGWVLRQACRQLRLWRRRYPETPFPSVSVNLSAKQLTYPGLAEEVFAILESESIEPSSLQLEITESAIIEDAIAAKTTLDRLQERGIRLAVDDFGIGHSSISYLTNFPVNTVKIDQSIVTTLNEDDSPRGEAVITAVMSLAGSLGELVVAEGIEDEEKLQSLEKLGCEFGQGNYLCPPYPAEKVLDFYVDNLRRPTKR